MTRGSGRCTQISVDTVLYFEGEAGGPFRLVRAIKNRFGAVNELGVFAMGDKGLREVKNPSAIFLSRHDALVPGSVVMVTREGTRPLLVEVKALVNESPLANPQRVTLGLDANRLSMLLAVLHRHGGIGMFARDVFVNVVGGVRIGETAADLAVLAPVLSSVRDRPLAWPGGFRRGRAVRGDPPRPQWSGPAARGGQARPAPGHSPRRKCPKGGVDGLEILPVRGLREALDAL